VFVEDSEQSGSGEKFLPEVYNADEQSQFWRYIPRYTYVTAEETSPMGFKDLEKKKRNHQNYWVFGSCTSSCILESRKHNFSETGSLSFLVGEDTYLVGSLRKS
jgi:hypothetical protein